MAESLRLRVAAVTHRGCVKPANEDTVGVADWIRSASMEGVVTLECRTDEPRVCVVADGLGGHAAGQVASGIVVRELMRAAPELRNGEAVVEHLRRINRELFDAMAGAEELSGMGSTVVGVVAHRDRLIVFNAGDSRAYSRSEAFLQIISTDDVRNASTDPSGRTGQQGHVITQCLGGDSHFLEVHPHVSDQRLTPGARLLLCSDGLTNLLDLDRIESYIQRNCEAGVAGLLSAALTEGGHDNISVIIIDVEE